MALVVGEDGAEGMSEISGMGSEGKGSGAGTYPLVLDFASVKDKVGQVRIVV